MHSLSSADSMFLLGCLPSMRQQLVHLSIGNGMINHVIGRNNFLHLAALSALTHLTLCADAGPAGAMSAMLAGGAGSMPRLKSLSCVLNSGRQQLMTGPAVVSGLYDLRALVAACPALEQLALNQHGCVFAQDVASSPLAACQALQGLTALTALTLRTDDTWADDAIF
jgi:hypothetical protein